MRQATINVDIAGVTIREVVSFTAATEETVLMGLLHQRVKDLVKKRQGGFVASFVPKGNKLMRKLVCQANAYFKRTDPEPSSWLEFRAWAQQYGYMTITEV
jgi:hypothetical protein